MRRDDPRSPSDRPFLAEVRAVADALGEGVAICRAGRIAWANARLAELAGVESGAALAQGDFAALFDGDEPPAAGRAVACRVRRPGDARSVVVRGVALAGDEVVFVVQDLTHVQALEEEVLRAGRELARLHREVERLRERTRRESQEREELLTVVAHELRTPATVIAGYARLLLSGKVGPLTDEQRRFLDESVRACQRLNAFLGNLLETARQTAGDWPLEVREAALAPSVEGVAAALKPLLEEKGISVEVRIDPRAAAARFDPVRLEQVLLNLLSNALRHAPAGSAIEVATRALSREGLGFVEVAVADEGPGVPPEERERIFLPWVRAGHGRAAGGLGLGLAICKRIVEAHGGTIRVEPRAAGRGSRFSFTLPAPASAAGREA
jgi:signal transduction histidine kinase